MKRTIIVAIGAVVVLFLIVGIGLITGYNSLLDDQYQVTECESDIEIEIAARHNALGGIIDAIQGLQQHEAAIYDKITAARGLYDHALATGDPNDMIAADAAQAEAIQGLADFLAYANIEDNPDFVVDSIYQSYVDTIILAEGIIAVARQDYNTAVTRYNTQVRKFPKVLYASLLGFPSTFEYWHMSDGDAEIPTIDF